MLSSRRRRSRRVRSRGSRRRWRRLAVAGLSSRTALFVCFFYLFFFILFYVISLPILVISRNAFEGSVSLAEVLFHFCNFCLGFF